MGRAVASERIPITLSFTFEEAVGERLDKFLVSRLPEYSRSRLQQLIRDGWVNVNDRPAKKAGLLLEAGDRVTVTLPPPEPSALTPEPIPLEIIYEDENLLVVNKPAGMVVHPAAGHFSGTLVHAALAHAPPDGRGGR